MSQLSEASSSFKAGVRDGIPIGLGYFAVSFSFGIMAVSAGLKVWQAGLISLTNLTSAGQFAGLNVIAAGGSYFEIILTQLIINLRYLLMSFSLGQKLPSDTPIPHRLGVAFGITDEIFGVSVSKPGSLNPCYSYGAMSMAIPGWTLGTVIGGICGNVLPAMLVSALSVALYGMFLAVIVPPAKKSTPVRIVVLLSMAISTLFSLVPVLKQVSSGLSIIIITVGVSALAAFLFPVRDESEE